MNAPDVVSLLDLSPHPEGGWFRETWRAPSPPGERSGGTAIYYLLAEGERSHWHRLDASEIWHYYAGDPLELRVSPDGVSTRPVVLGVGLDQQQRPQCVVPAGDWQSARPLGRWTLVGCTVTPGFEFAGFELAPPGWQPG